MTDRDLAADLATEFYSLVAWKTAAEVYFSRLRVNGAPIAWKVIIDQEAEEAVYREEQPFYQKLTRIRTALDQSTDNALLLTLHTQLTTSDDS